MNNGSDSRSPLHRHGPPPTAASASASSASGGHQQEPVDTAAANAEAARLARELGVASSCGGAAGAAGARTAATRAAAANNNSNNNNGSSSNSSNNANGAAGSSATRWPFPSLRGSNSNGSGGGRQQHHHQQRDHQQPGAAPGAHYTASVQQPAAGSVASSFSYNRMGEEGDVGVVPAAGRRAPHPRQRQRQRQQYQQDQPPPSSSALNLLHQSSSSSAAAAVSAVALEVDSGPSYGNSGNIDNGSASPHAAGSVNVGGASQRQHQLQQPQPDLLTPNEEPQQHQQQGGGAGQGQGGGAPAAGGDGVAASSPRAPPPSHPQPSSLHRNAAGNEPIHLYDAHGQRAPYKEGPYFIAREKDGRVVKKRWYGRLEDGYLAWSSIYMHEYFGFEIYTPLTPDEEQELKVPGGKVPRWMYEFTSLPNLAIPMSYFCIGVALQLLRTPLIVYFIEDLGATAAEVNVLFTVMAVPWCFKVIYGFLSDCVPISGLRRKPYFMSGWLVYIVSNLILMITPIPSIQLCILLVFTQTAGYMLADVMTDALIVERSRFETQEKRGTMQSTGYIIRFFGSTIGASIGAVVYNKDDWNWYLPIRLVFFMNAAFPMVFLVPFVPYLLELDSNARPRNFYRQCHDLFQTAQLRAVWQPMTFVYIYNALQLTNAAWMNFLVQGLDFSAWQIGLVSIIGSIMAWFGIMTYKRFFFASNWRIVYFWCTTLASLIALGQLILVFGINRDWGIPDIWFSMGDDVLVEFVIAVQFLPMCIMYLGLCPPGSEGTTYAMLTTWSNLAGSLAFDISTALTVVWDVSSQTIAAGDYSGVWKLSLLCGVIGPVPLILLSLIPKNKEDQRQLQQDKTRHYWAGVAFITVMILTLLVTFVESVYEVYFNDEEGERQDAQRRRLKRLLVGH